MEPSSALWFGWWEHADPVIRGVFITLVVMSILSWTVMLEKFWQLRRWYRVEREAASLIERGDLSALERGRGGSGKSSGRCPGAHPQ